ncbi:MAG: peptidase, partial [Planctomycetaceae bacterium]
RRSSDLTGGSIASNDDSRGPDSYFRFNVPADGDYYLRIRDHLGRGGQDFVYRVEFQAIKPSLALSIPRVERYGQYRQQIYVGRGNRYATTFNISRRNFGGEIVVNPKELPAGLTMHVEKVAANMSVAPVVFEAAADAPLNGGLFDFTAQHAENADITGGFGNVSDFIIGAPGQSRYYTKAVQRLPIAVVEEIPFKLDIVAPKVPIARNGSMKLKIVATKKEGWDETITIQLPFRPPGIGTSSSIQIPKGQTEGYYPLNANGSAAIGTWKVFVVGWANVGNGNGFASSDLTPLDISEPFVSLAMNRAACEQGQPTEIVCKVTIAKPFDEAATVRIFGLPNKAVTEPVQLTKDLQEIIFKVTTDKTTPAGRHKSVFAQITIPMNGEEIVHNVGGTELRVDKPLPPKVEPKPAAKPAVAAAPKPAPKPTAAPPRRLSRLEMLRLEKAKKAEAAGAGK